MVPPGLTADFVNYFHGMPGGILCVVSKQLGECFNIVCIIPNTHTHTHRAPGPYLCTNRRAGGPITN